MDAELGEDGSVFLGLRKVPSVSGTPSFATVALPSARYAIPAAMIMINSQPAGRK
jgi:hypothetical protein